jgi:hypothetical protein
MEHPEEPAEPGTQITPDDATPDGDVERPDPPEPDPDHVVEESGRED